MIRHIPTKLNEGGPEHERSRGWGNFPPDPEQLKILIPKIAATLKDKSIHRLVSSDLPRAALSAKALSEEMGIPYHPTSDLRTWNTGDLNGKLEEDVKHTKIAAIKHPDLPIPGGEPFSKFTDRWGTALNKLMDHNEQNPDDQVAAVIHGNMDMSADSVSRDEPVTPEHYEKMRPPGAISVLKWSKTQSPKVFAIDDKAPQKDAQRTGAASTDKGKPMS